MEMTKATAASRKSPTSRREGAGAQLDQSRTRSSWRRARGEPRLIDPWRVGLVNVIQSNGSASLKCQLYPDKPSRFITGAQPKAGTGLKMQTVRFFNVTLLGIYR